VLHSLSPVHDTERDSWGGGAQDGAFNTGTHSLHHALTDWAWALNHRKRRASPVNCPVRLFICNHVYMIRPRLRDQGIGFATRHLEADTWRF